MSNNKIFQMSDFSKRLKEERNRLKLNQADFGALGGVLKGAQLQYEKGERSPDAKYLEAIAANGVDIQYLLTGERNSQVTQLNTKQDLENSKTALSEMYLELNSEQQREIYAEIKERIRVNNLLETVEKLQLILEDLKSEVGKKN